jgi:hypothetical protein
MIHHERNGAKLEVDFEKWLMSYDISLSFQNIRKKIVDEGVITKFYQISPKAGAYVQYFLDIVLERDVRNQAGISD